MAATRKTVTVVMTVKNDAVGCAVTLDSLAAQARLPDEIIIVDGGSTDGTVEVIRKHAARNPRIQLIEAVGTNIAQGRNIAADAAAGEIIACTDSGCRALPDWLEKLTRPFQDDQGPRGPFQTSLNARYTTLSTTRRRTPIASPISKEMGHPARSQAPGISPRAISGEGDPQVEFVAGFYSIDSHTLLEEVVGLATMRGQLDPVSDATFNPSARSMACTKGLWLRAGGWPEWIGFSEDTLFDHKVRRMDVGWRFAGDAVVLWRPRGSIRAIARQFYNYGTGRGHTQIDAAGYTYNLRNVALLAAVAGLCFITNWAIPALGALLLYFYVWTFHHKALRIAQRTERFIAYPLCIVVMWAVLASSLVGYLVGSWQRWRDRGRYRYRMETYLAET